MKKRFKKLLSVLMICALVVVSAIGFSVTSFAASDSPKSAAPNGSSYHVYYVGTEIELRNALYYSDSGDYIQFYNDIIVNGNLEVKNGVAIDLYYHSLVFNDSSKGLTIDSGRQNLVGLYNGRVYADFDSDAAVYVRSGNLRVYNCSIYAGNCNKHDVLYYGNALYCDSSSSKIYLDYAYLQGGNGYNKGFMNPSRTGKAIYLSSAGSAVYAVGGGYTFLDGECV